MADNGDADDFTLALRDVERAAMAFLNAWQDASTSPALSRLAFHDLALAMDRAVAIVRKARIDG